VAENWLKNAAPAAAGLVDVYRPAAREQLKIVAQAVRPISMKVKSAKPMQPRSSVWRRGTARSDQHRLGRAPVDTAGRLHIDDQLMDGMRSLKGC
jgi:signal recognition particle subunit SRP54